MKQVVATCIYQDNAIYNLCVQYKERTVTLVSYDEDKPDPYHYKYFEDMYKDVLSILKQNGYYTKSFSAFDREFYNINFVNLDCPMKISRHGLHKNY